MSERKLDVTQGAPDRLIGFVPRRGEIACANHDDELNILRVRGASFFTLPLVDAGHTTRRRLDRPGLVELSCGGGSFWLRGFLFVLEHPYAALSRSDGSFTLAQVPAGSYELSAWLPNWRVASTERDPESAAINRLRFAPPVELEQTVAVRPSETATVTFEVSTELFEPTEPRSSGSGRRLTAP
jgi:hypothetical protein